jgi:FAD/FMN-containing dehydrogenase
MKKRDLLKAALALPLLAGTQPGGLLGSAWAGTTGTRRTSSRVRPGDPAWPSAASWNKLNRAVGGQLLRLESPFAHCEATSASAICKEALARLKNPYFVGDQPALTQTSGWVDAWTSQPSAYAVAAKNTAHVVAAVDFARQHNLRLVVKGGGHSYQGTSDAPDSLLVWTRHMNDVTLHDAFVAQGCAGSVAPQPAVSLGAGAVWMDAYTAVTTRAGRYVQGGGCATVGVAGLIQSGGFGSFSKNFGTAAAGLLEAELVMADGQVRIANPRTNPELYWGIKGGGGGSLGVITRLTLRTRELPATFGAVFGDIRAASDEAYRALIARVVDFYRDALFNPHWGESLEFGSHNDIHFSLVFQGLSQQQAEQIWAPLLDWVRAHQEYSFESPVKILTVPARHFWDAAYINQQVPGAMLADDRPGAAAHHAFWAGDQGQVGWFIHGYQSAWLPESLLRSERQSLLVDALFECSRTWSVALHFNKGLAGAPAGEIAAARDTAMNPAVLDAFALAIIAGGESPAYAGMPGAGPDLPAARDAAGAIGKAMRALQKAAPDAGSYVSESDYFNADWQRAFWGSNYPRLAAVKRKYDPDGLFFVHHGVGSEAWSADGFSRLMT